MFSSTPMSKEPCTSLSGLFQPPKHVRNLMFLFLLHLLIVFVHPAVPFLKDLRSKSPNKLIKNKVPDSLKNMKLTPMFLKVPGCLMVHQSLQTVVKLTPPFYSQPSLFPALNELLLYSVSSLWFYASNAVHSILVQKSQPVSSLSHSLSESQATLFKHLHVLLLSLLLLLFF